MKKRLYLLSPVLFLCFGISSSLAKTTPLFLSDTTIYQTFSICEGDSIVVGNSVYTEAGIYQDVLLSSQSGDSTVITNIILLLPEILLPQTIKVCSEENLSLEIAPRALQRAFTTVVGTPLPDAVGMPMDVPFFVNSFSPGQEIETAQDLSSICLSMEHSWMHDLEILLICPSGQRVMLQNQELIGDEVFLGAPYELDDIDTPNPPHPGIGWNYCWSSEAPETFTEYSNAHPNLDTLPEGVYRPFESFYNLVGCPLNGMWIIRVNDYWAQDNGWAFEGAISFQTAVDTTLNFLWSTGETTPSITISETGQYSVTVTGAQDCVVTDTVAVILQIAQIVALPQEHQFLALPAGASSYQWYKDGEPITGAIQQFYFHNNVTGIYTVTVNLYGSVCQSLPFQLLDYQDQQFSVDCVNAIPVCHSIFLLDNYLAQNLVNDFEDPDNQAGCLFTEETAPRWYRFSFSSEMPAGSTFEFEIKPEDNSGNFNFAIYGPGLSCDSLSSPIRCSYATASCPGCPTGLNSGASDTSEDSSGDGFLAPLAVEPGQSYYLLINATSFSFDGFQLIVGGSAAPYLDCSDDFCAIWVDAGNDQVICYDQAFMLDDVAVSASQNVTYEWIGRYGESVYLDDATKLNPMVTLPSGFSYGELEYTLIVNDGNCAVADNVKISVGRIESSGITGEVAFCENGLTFLTIEGVTPFYMDYEWSTGSTESSILVSEPGFYTIDVWNETGCHFEDGVQVRELIPEIELETDDGSLRLSPLISGVTYQWYLNNQEIENATGPVYFPSQNGVYFIKVTYQGVTCSSAPLTVTDTDEVMLEEIEYLKATPNPTIGQINVESNLPMNHLMILNAFGQQLQQVPGDGRTTLPLDFSDYPSGIYWVLVEMRDRIRALKVGVTK